MMVALFGGNPIAGMLADVTALLFLGICAWVASYEVFRRDKVDLNKVVGGLCIYVPHAFSELLGNKLETYKLVQGFHETLHPHCERVD